MCYDIFTQKTQRAEITCKRQYFLWCDWDDVRLWTSLHTAQGFWLSKTGLYCWWNSTAKSSRLKPLKVCWWKPELSYKVHKFKCQLSLTKLVGRFFICQRKETSCAPPGLIQVKDFYYTHYLCKQLFFSPLWYLFFHLVCQYVSCECALHRERK